MGGNSCVCGERGRPDRNEGNEQTTNSWLEDMIGFRACAAIVHTPPWCRVQTRMSIGCIIMIDKNPVLMWHHNSSKRVKGGGAAKRGGVGETTMRLTFLPFISQVRVLTAQSDTPMRWAARQ